MITIKTTHKSVFIGILAIILVGGVLTVNVLVYFASDAIGLDVTLRTVAQIIGSILYVAFVLKFMVSIEKSDDENVYRDIWKILDNMSAGVEE